MKRRCSQRRARARAARPVHRWCCEETLFTAASSSSGSSASRACARKRRQAAAAGECCSPGQSRLWPLSMLARRHRSLQKSTPQAHGGQRARSAASSMPIRPVASLRCVLADPRFARQRSHVNDFTLSGIGTASSGVSSTMISPAAIVLLANRARPRPGIVLTLTPGGHGGGGAASGLATARLAMESCSRARVCFRRRRRRRRERQVRLLCDEREMAICPERRARGTVNEVLVFLSPYL